MDKDCNPLVAMHWEHRFNHMVKRYNDIHRVQMPNITPHVCRHTYCSNMAKSGMNPKTLQYLMGHSDIGVTLNTYTHLGLEDATDELRRMEDLENARKELEKNKEEKPVLQKMFRAIGIKRVFAPCFGRAIFLINWLLLNYHGTISVSKTRVGY